MGGLVRRRSFEDVDGGLHGVYGGTAGDDTVDEAVAGETFDGGRIHEEDEMEAVVVGWPIQNGFSDGKFLRRRIIADVDVAEDTADDGVI